MTRWLSVVLCALAWLGTASAARAWDPFRSPNGHVEDGNERMAARDYAGAQRAYEQAARELPNEPGVHLNRGLALLAAGQHDRAREALLLATEPPASAEIRAAAYYDIGLAFYQQADARAGADQHEEAQRLFRESADAFRRSLRARPGNRAAGWNLELALRRIREEEERQRQEQQAQQQQQNQQQQDQQQQNQQQQDQQQQNQQQQDQQQQDQQQQDQQQQGQQQAQNQQQQQQNQQQQQGQQNQQQAQNQQQQQQNQQQQQQGQQSQQQRQQQQQQAQAQQRQQQQDGQRGSQAQQAQAGPRLPSDVSRVLDALEDGEENLERYRARVRAARDPQRPTKDW